MAQVRLADAVERVNDTVDPRIAKSTLYVGLEHLSPGAFYWDYASHSDGVTSSKSAFKAGDILYGKLRPYLDKVVVATADGICSTELLVFRPKAGVNPLYLLAVLHSRRFTNFAMKGITGANHPRTSWFHLKDFQFELPAPEMQVRIGSAMDDIIHSIRNQDARSDRLNDLRAAAMRGFFDRRPEVLGDERVDWSTMRLGDIAEISSGGTPSRGESAYWKDGDIPWVKTTEIDYSTICDTSEKITSLGLEHSAAKMLVPGTLLMAMYGQGTTRGKVAILGIPAATNQACAAIRVKREDVDPRFIFYYLRSQYDAIRALAHGGQQQNLNLDLIRGINVHVPAPSIQAEVVKVLNSIDAASDALRVRTHHLRNVLRSTLDQLVPARMDDAA